jgi:hypothetical protein
MVDISRARKIGGQEMLPMAFELARHRTPSSDAPTWNSFRRRMESLLR